MSDWLTSRPHARTMVEEEEHVLELAEKFASFMRLANQLDEACGREAKHYELMPDDQRHAWSECFSATIDAVANGHNKKWDELAQRTCQSFESALQISDVVPWDDRLARDKVYWETIARHAANLIEWCGDDASIEVIEAHMVAQMRDRIGS